MRPPEKNRLEWLVFGISLVLVVLTFAYLLREAITTEVTPPDIVVMLGTPRPGSGGFMVPLVATNHGGQTAEDVQITVTLDLADGTSEESEILIPFLPRESKREGWATFRSDPQSGDLRVGGIGFQSP
jgi:uncharacterized protein (TIGR02588 family)